MYYHHQTRLDFSREIIKRLQYTNRFIFRIKLIEITSLEIIIKFYIIYGRYNKLVCSKSVVTTAVQYKLTIIITKYNIFFKILRA